MDLKKEAWDIVTHIRARWGGPIEVEDCEAVEEVLCRLERIVGAVEEGLLDTSRLGMVAAALAATRGHGQSAGSIARRAVEIADATLEIVGAEAETKKDLLADPEPLFHMALKGQTGQ